MTKLAQRITIQEGGWHLVNGELVGRPGTIPFERNNPGDLRHSPHSTHDPDDPDGIGTIDTLANGIADLERQLVLYSERGMTLREAIYSWAPPSENDSAAYLANVIAGFEGQVDADTPLCTVLDIMA
jgi:hypothetical protein